MRYILLAFFTLIIFSCNNSSGPGIPDGYIDDFLDGSNTDNSEIYFLTGAIQYENEDCTGSETYYEGMCIPIDENDPNAISCIFMNLMEDSQLVEYGCNEELACEYLSYSEMMPLTITFLNNGTMIYNLGEMCTNIIILNQNECTAEGNSWLPETTVNGTCIEVNNTITCNSSISDDSLVFIRTSADIIIGQNIDVDEEGEVSCNGMVLTKQ